MTNAQAINRKASMSRLQRATSFLYGIVAYSAFFATILYTIGFVMGFAVPKNIDTGGRVSAAEAVVVNLMLLSLFAVQHSVMARTWFKRWWTQYVPKPVERSTYVLLASLCLALLFWQWRPMPATVWQVEDPDAAALIAAISLVGWAIVFMSTFMIDHFELFGLHQVTANLTGRALPPPQFRTPLFYKFVRHPLYLGFIVAFWATPDMTVGHLLFATVTTAYIFVGIFFEERDLVELFGDDYREYKKSVAVIIPLRRPVGVKKERVS